MRSLQVLLILGAIVDLRAATLVDLRLFFADPGVVVAPDGMSASFAEQVTLSSVLLANDPGLGDPIAFSPASGFSLLFDFVFQLGSGESDEFAAFLIDGSTGLPIGLPYFRQSSGVGTIAFDLSPLITRTLGLQFQLSSLPGDSGLSSVLFVSNVRVDSNDVPESSSIALAAMGFLGSALFARVFRRER